MMACIRINNALLLNFLHSAFFYDVIPLLLLERFRITFKANGRTDHVTMFTPYVLLTVSTFSVKLSSFALF